MVLLSCLHGKSPPKKISRRGLDVAHPDLFHLLGIDFDLHGLLAVFSLFVEFRLIRREVCSDDARARRIYLTASGRRLVQQLYDDWTPLRRKLREIFAGDAGTEALRILDEVRDVMTKARQEITEKQAEPQKRTRK